LNEKRNLGLLLQTHTQTKSNLDKTQEQLSKLGILLMPTKNPLGVQSVTTSSLGVMLVKFTKEDGTVEEYRVINDLDVALVKKGEVNE
jgi:hypothetical protein